GSSESVEYEVMDFGYSYHMCLKNGYFGTLELVEGEVVHLGDGKA
ncbi:hypothetical protein A2U01_0094888, partial [Trifolium medium]|nr:hypothetical protein [Trifolium medium]